MVTDHSQETRDRFAHCQFHRGTFLLLGVTLSLLGSCSDNGVPLNGGVHGDNAASAAPKEAHGGSSSVLRLATTTSTRDSGLLDELLPAFEKSQSCRVDVIAVGTGAALKLGEAGDVDVVIVHARKAEEAFMKSGHGTRHEEFMFNDFVILGPPDDPAKIRDIEPVAAMRKIAEGQHRFISRGDDSGTHKRELSLRETAGIHPDWEGYIEGGQGMGPTLMMADEKRAYVLADRGTFLKFRDKIDLVALAKVDASLRNPYAVIVVNPQKHARINAALADSLVDFLISDIAQKQIADYRVAGQQLFTPTRLAADR